MAELPNASAYRSVAGPSRVRAFPCYSFAALLQAALVLRRARLSRAFPSRRRAKQISSFAALGLAGLLRRRAAPRYARPFRRLPEQIKALPLQRPSPHRHRAARQSHANPLPPTSSRCRRISLKAALRCSVAPPRYSAQVHRRTTPLIALPSRSVAALRQAVATPARSRRSTRSGPCRCCATGRCRGTARSRAIPARAASPTCSSQPA